MRSAFLWLSAGLTSLIFAVPAYAGDRAEELGTKFGDSENSVARKVLMAPGDYDLDFPAFLVGIEKAKRKNIGAPRLPDLELGLRGWAEKYIDWVTFANVPLPGVEKRAERMFVSHLIEFARPAGGKDAYKAMIRYSAYRPEDLASARDAYDEGHKQLLGLREGLEAAIERERPTHLIVFTTGWKTDQGGTFEGMKRIRESLAKTAGAREFRPLLIGISWPSLSERLVGDLKQVTYNVKSSDADEVGLVWASTLVNQVLVPLRDDLRKKGRLAGRPDVVVIGHSFGARIATWTAFCGGLRSDDKGGDEVRGPDVVIGLQGAFSLSRFLPGEGIEGAPYAARPDGVRLAYTCSEHDNAVETFNNLAKPINRLVGKLAAKFDPSRPPEEAGFGVPLIGGKTAFQHDSEATRRAIEHRVVKDDEGNLDRSDAATDGKVLLIDASKVIIKPADGIYALASGAHSDIYNEGVGRLIWQVLAPPPTPR